MAGCGFGNIQTPFLRINMYFDGEIRGYQVTKRSLKKIYNDQAFAQATKLHIVGASGRPKGGWQHPKRLLLHYRILFIE